MIRFNRSIHRFALCALLLCFSLVSAADDFQEANKLFKHGQSAQALTKIEAILAAQPKDAQTRFLKGLIQTEQGNTEEAIRIYTTLTTDYPELPEPYNNLAVIYAGKGEYDKAKTALEAALRTHPGYSTAHENLGDIYAQMASQAYGRALQLNRNNTESKTKLSLISEIHTPPVKTITKTQVASLSTPSAPVKVAASLAQKPEAAVITPATPIGTALPVTANPPAPSKAEATTAKVNVPTSSTSNSNDEILKIVQDWAKAWSSRNAKKYLTMYANDFKTPNNEARSVWEKQRRERIDKPQAIVVSIINPKIKMVDETHANVSFVQSYRSGKLKSITRKTLMMIMENQTWKIQSEQTGN